MWLSAVLCVCLVPAMVPAKRAMSRHQQELKEHYEHLAKIAEFECDLPQPRLLNVHELLSDFQIRGKAYFPEVTVLHRCDRHVGSCNDAAHQCGPLHVAEVKMPFKVTFLEEMTGHKRGEWEMEYHTMQNHTACGCLKYDGVPPTMTAVHYHYIDPALVPPAATPIPLDPSSQNAQGTASSYDVPLYQNSTPPSVEGSYSGPSIYDMTKLAEESVKPSPNEVKPDEETPCLSCTNASESHYLDYHPSESPAGDKSSTPASESEYPGYGGYQPSEPSTGDRSSTPEVPSVPENADSYHGTNDADSTTIPEELIRFGSGDSPKAEALTNQDNPYDSFLRQAYT